MDETNDEAYSFGAGKVDPRLADLCDGDLATMLGGKGAGLVRMVRQGIPVPPGFVVPVDVCHRYSKDGSTRELAEAVIAGLDRMGVVLGRTFGDPTEPFVVSVRSGASVSMPGMMDTVLNVGITAEIALRLGRLHDDPRFGWDTYLRFLRSFADIVLQVPESVLAELPAPGGEVTEQAVSDALDLLAAAGNSVPMNPSEQVAASVEAVMRSWHSDRARIYRGRHGIPEDLGFAVTIQAMVFGNRSGTSGAGVAFSRDPATGSNELTGDFLTNVQGEDVVSGAHATLSIAAMGGRWPELNAQLEDLARELEMSHRDMVDIEFTIEDGELWIVQCRVGTRSPLAALRMAVDMAEDPMFPLDRAEAVARVAHLLDTAHAVGSEFEADANQILVTGLAASPGVATGVAIGDLNEAIRLGDAGDNVILVRSRTSPVDIGGMAKAVGLVTTRGGMASHGAVIAREWGLPAVVGAVDLTITGEGFVGPLLAIDEGEVITVDGTRGIVVLGDHVVETIQIPEQQILRSWRDGAVQQGAPPIVASANREIDVDDVVRVLSVKGAITVAMVTEVLGAPSVEVGRLVDGLSGQGHLAGSTGGMVRLTPAGEGRAAALWASEAAVVGSEIRLQMPRFDELNRSLKMLVTDWQLRRVDGELVPNDHTDPAYDNHIFDHLEIIDQGIGSILADLLPAVPRFARYRQRFEAALRDLRAGDRQMMAHPLKGSYHSVWFELHEELIRLTGANRTQEEGGSSPPENVQ